MPDPNDLLDIIEKGIVEHGGDLGGWTRRADDMLQLFDGRVTLRAELAATPPDATGMVHAHVFTTLHEHDDEVLDACLMGLGEDDQAALGQAAVIWITCVAGPIKSFLDNQPVCMTCQAGVADGDPSKGYVAGDYGLRGLRAYVGPSIARGIDNQDHSQIDETKPWFRFAAESAAPRRVHLAKATILGEETGAWRRMLEIDGHDVSLQDPNWQAGVRAAGVGYITRFAVFEFPRNSKEIARRAQLEHTIQHFAENYSKHENVDHLMQAMEQQGFDADTIKEVESISTIAFGRTLFEPMGVEFSPVVIRARRDGRIEADVPLLSIPAYSRALAIAAKLRETMPEEEFQAICLYNAESNAILQALESAGDQLDMTQMKMYPCVVPDRGVSDQTMDTALAMLNDMVQQSVAAEQAKKKPWWKFW